MRMQWIPGLLSPPPPLEGLGARLTVAVHMVYRISRELGMHGIYCTQPQVASRPRASLH